MIRVAITIELDAPDGADARLVQAFVTELLPHAHPWAPRVTAIAWPWSPSGPASPTPLVPDADAEPITTRDPGASGAHRLGIR